MGKPQQVQPQVTQTIPAEFLPFARNLVQFLGGRMAQPFPNTFQSGLLGAFFGPGAQQTYQMTAGTPAPSGPSGSLGGSGAPVGAGASSGNPGAALLDFLNGGTLGASPMGGERPLFGPAGTNPVVGGRVNTSVMGFLERLFPGYQQRAAASMRTPQAFAPSPMGDLLASGDPWAQEVARARAESAARNVGIDALMAELNQQREAMGLPPL
jgi:hypothetical protein